ncbi:glutaredoxin family protein [Halobacillus litoralis]|uniref:NrdH-redoxin n=1 Tax=Halobacillus litoralis TaxID=45668 RepID=A0A410MJ86_9BACI|nr:glutaredoxin domain-containing protein [Halobacillus litoralis]QAS54804.1 NrdH-redoxin [Halobacillus litoralis]
MRVSVYTSQSCGFCKRIKDWYLSQGIHFVEKDVQKNPLYKDELLELGVKGIPFSLIESSEKTVEVLGFNKKELEDLFLK